MKIEMIYSEVLNSTEIILIFQRTYYGHDYGVYATINLASPVPEQDSEIARALFKLEHLDGESARNARERNNKKTEA